MKIFGMSDPHLSISTPDKTMEVFGKRWERYLEKIDRNWNQVVSKNDIVIMPGDISWCTRLSETFDDFKFLDDFNGIKLISKGNHDYWFSTKKKVITYFDNNFESLKLVEKNPYNHQNKYIVTGFKGFNPQVEKAVYEKQLQKQYNSLRLLLRNVSKEYAGVPVILGYHFPPLFNEELRFHKLFKTFNVKYCLYGHTHIDYEQMFVGERDGINYHFVASDYLEFKPKLILET